MKLALPSGRSPVPIPAHLRRAVQTGTATHARQLLAPAYGRLPAEHAAEVVALGAKTCWWLIRCDDALQTCQQAKAVFSVILNAFGVPLIGVFIHHEIQPSRQAEVVHSKLKLRIVQRLAHLAAFLPRRP